MEMKCPRCNYDMKEYVLKYRCRKLECGFTSKKVFTFLNEDMCEDKIIDSLLKDNKTLERQNLTLKQFNDKFVKFKESLSGGSFEWWWKKINKCFSLPKPKDLSRMAWIASKSESDKENV